MCSLSILLISTVSLVFYLVSGQGVLTTPCPNIFQYYRQSNGDTYGRIMIPYDGSTTLNLGVNASMKGFYTDNGRSGLLIKMVTPGYDLISQRAKILIYNIFFPFQHTIPKITNIELNNKGYCTGPPEKLIPGSPGVSSLWAEHRFYFQIPIKNDDFESSNPTNPVEDPGPPVAPSTPEIISPYPSLNQQFDNSVGPVVPSRNQNQGCGVTKNTIVPLILGGTEITDGTFPWLVAMFVSKGTGYDYKCTANLISEKHVLTAARCVNFHKVQIVQTEQILLVLGKMNLKNWASKGAVTRGASKIQTHPDFNQDSSLGDVSIITLDRVVQFSDAIAPICLWPEDNDFLDIIGKKGTVAGWGADEVTQKSGQLSVSTAKSVDMPIVSDEDCLFSNLSFYSLTSDMTFCAGERDGTGTCVGDSGAGFMINKEGKYYLRGLSSMALTDSNGKCDLSYFMIFCDVAKFIDWIKSNIK